MKHYFLYTNEVLDLLRLVTVVAVDEAVVQQASASAFTDFEDGIRHFAAVAVPADEAIVTRNPKDFRNSILPVLMPVQALSQL